ncbi:MAG: sirohydrochlorin cobaltochelatase [Candidatus Limivicinus sp.]
MKTLKKMLAALLALCMVLALSACGEETPAEKTAEEAAEEAPAAETAAKPVILAVSFGTSYNDSRDITIGAIEKALAEAYPDYEVRRAFTSQIIIDKLAERDKLEIDNVTEAMDRLVADGVKDVVIQPTHVMAGFEYDDVMAEIAHYTDKFDSMKVGAPMLTTDEDYDRLISVITEETAAYDEEGTAIIWMGHGTEHESNATYAKLQDKLSAAGYDNYFVGTVEATPTLEDVIALAKDYGAKKVVLLPLMVVAGDHANNDMAGDEEGSWKTEFEAAGFEVECVLKGLGQYEGARDIYVSHVADAINK